MTERTMAQYTTFKISDVVKTTTMLTRNSHEDCLDRDRELALYFMQISLTVYLPHLELWSQKYRRRKYHFVSIDCL